MATPPVTVKEVVSVRREALATGVDGRLLLPRGRKNYNDCERAERSGKSSPPQIFRCLALLPG